MELSVAIVLMVGLCFIGVIGTKLGQVYFKTEEKKGHNDVEIQRKSEALRMEHQLQLVDAKAEIKYLKSSNKNYQYKINTIRSNYDVDYEDIDEPEGEDDVKLSELAHSIYPKLPPSLGRLIDREEFQNAIIKTVEKKPDILNTFIDKFISKSSDQGGSSLNTTPTLKETYL